MSKIEQLLEKILGLFEKEASVQDEPKRGLGLGPCGRGLRQRGGNGFGGGRGQGQGRCRNRNMRRFFDIDDKK